MTVNDGKISDRIWLAYFNRSEIHCLEDSCHSSLIPPPLSSSWILSIRISNKAVASVKNVSRPPWISVAKRSRQDTCICYALSLGNSPNGLCCSLFFLFLSSFHNSPSCIDCQLIDNSHIRRSAVIVLSHYIIRLQCILRNIWFKSSINIQLQGKLQNWWYKKIKNKLRIVKEL